MNNIQNIASLCRNIPLLLIQITYIFVSLQEIGKTQQCANYTVQLSEEANFIILGTKLYSIATTWREDLPYWNNSCENF